MNITKKELKVLSTDKIHDLAGVLYIPEGEIRGFFHVVHGMTEYMGRYEKIMTEMAEEGWLCFGYDHLGHGNTAKDSSELGYIADKNGWDLLCRDVKAFSDKVIADYSEGKKLPYVLMGHSMGSFIARLASEKYVKPNRLIIMGTGGTNPAAGAGLALIETVKLFYGGKHISRLVYKLAFGNYNSRFPDNSREAPGAWLTHDIAIRQKYMHDPFCTFKFSVSAMGDLIRLMKYSNRPAWYKNLSRDIPILLVSGADDPVGNYGKGINEIFQKLQKNGFSADCKLYENARHEILNDTCREQVKKDILDFIN